MKLLLALILCLLFIPTNAFAMSCILANPEPLSRYEYAERIEVFFVGEAYEPIIAPTLAFPDEESLLGQKIKVLELLKGLPENTKEIDLYYGQTFSKNSWSKPDGSELYTAYFDTKRNRYSRTDINHCHNKLNFPREAMIEYFRSGKYQLDKKLFSFKNIALAVILLTSAFALILITSKYYKVRLVK